MSLSTLMQRRRQLKEKLQSREKVFGGWTSFGHPSITEIFAKAGFDFVGVDIEHSTISQEQAQRIISAGQGWGTLCLPRVASHNLEMVKRMLDSGGDGIIFPLVCSKAQAQEIVSWCRYSPVGKRSFGVARAQGYGFDYDLYTKEWNEALSIIIQIESKEGVKNIDEILTVDGIDGVMIGPFDLSGSMGIPGQLDHPKVKKACQKVIDSCAKHKISCGNQIVEPNLELIEKTFKSGFTFTILGSDLFALWKWAQNMKDFIQQTSS